MIDTGMSRARRYGGGALCVAIVALAAAGLRARDREEPPGLRLARSLAARAPAFAAALRGDRGTWSPEDGRLTSPGWRAERLGSHPSLGARLPVRADGALEVALGHSEGYRVRLTALGAAPVPVERRGLAFSAE